VTEHTRELGQAGGQAFTLVGFGEDGFGRLPLVQRNEGKIYRIEPAGPPPDGCGLGPELAPVLAALAAVRGARRRYLA
jgi:hypothetical protein